MKKLTALDMLFLTMESSKAPTHAGVLQIFDLPRNAGPGYVDRVYKAFLKAKPAAPFNCYPDMSALNGPRWREAEDFDSNYHVRRIALPTPGNDEQLMTLVSHLYPGLLDRRLPLWECYLIEGLQDGRFAVFLKVHHAYGDGMSGARALFHTMNDKPKAATITPIWAYEQPVQKKTPRVETKTIAKLEKAFSGAVKQVSSLSGASRELLQIGAQVLGLLPQDSKLPFSAPASSLHRPFHSGARNFAYGSISLTSVKTIARKCDATVNDVVMTICDHAMVQYLSEKGEAPQQALTGLMAVSTRAKGDRSSSNAAAVALTGLGEPGVDIVTRLQQVNRETCKVKEDIKGKSSETLFYSNLVMTIATQLSMQIPGLNDRLPPAANLFVSNIPGMTDKPMYLGSALMSGVYTAPIVQAGLPVNITLGSYHNQLCFGFGAASEVMPDTTHYASLCFQAFDELAGKTLGKKPPRATRRKSNVASK
jgi:WS/DGAT/MGAT family acyltransferase